MDDWHKVCITDKTGKRFYSTVASPLGTYSEIRNMQKRISDAKIHPRVYNFLDAGSAFVMVDGQPYFPDRNGGGDDELLAELKKSTEAV